MKHEHALAALLERQHAGGAVPDELKALVGSTSVWTNELGSTASFDVATSGAVTGTYVSAVSRTGSSVQGPITGWYSGHIITFAVTWPTDPAAMTAWVGAFVSSGSGFQIETLWQLVTQSQTTDPKQFWTAVNAGADVFTQMNLP